MGCDWQPARAVCDRSFGDVVVKTEPLIEDPGESDLGILIGRFFGS